MAISIEYQDHQNHNTQTIGAKGGDASFKFNNHTWSIVYGGEANPSLSILKDQDIRKTVKRIEPGGVINLTQKKVVNVDTITATQQFISISRAA